MPIVRACIADYDIIILMEKKEENPEEYLKIMEELKKLSEKDVSKGEELVERLTSKIFLSPYEVMMLDYNASEEDIKKKYRSV